MTYGGDYELGGTKNGWLRKANDNYNSTWYFTCFLFVRLLQFIGLVSVLGMTANWVSEMSGTANPGWTIVTTLVFAILGLLAVIITTVVVLEGATKGLFAIIGVDVVVLGFFAVLAGYWTLPAKEVHCKGLSNLDATAQTTQAQTFAQDLNSNASNAMAWDQSVIWWASTSKAACMEVNAVWIICLTLTILFFCSPLIVGGLYHKKTRGGATGTSEGCYG